MSAKQKGLLPMQGTVGEITFYKGRDGKYHIRQRSSIDKKRIASDPAFQRTREHISEFRAVLTANQQLFKLLAPVTRLVADKQMRNRLSSILMKVAKADVLNPRGYRNIMNGDASLLKGFEFSAAGGVGNVFKIGYAASIDRNTGKGVLSFPAMVPGEVVIPPQEASHYQLHNALVELNFQTGFQLLATRSTNKLPIDHQPVQAMKLETSVTAGSQNLLLLLFGIDFHVLTNGAYYSINNKVFNGLQIAEVSQPQN